MTDSSGAPIVTRAYDPWGNLLQGATAGGSAFTGRWWEPEVQLYDYRARWLQPKLGRFISEDPARTNAAKSEGDHAASNGHLGGRWIPRHAEDWAADAGEVARDLAELHG